MSDTEAALEELFRHLQELTGDDPLSYGPLGNEMGYQEETEDLADPMDLEDDQHVIDGWIKKVRSKLKTIPAQQSPLKPKPAQDTVTKSTSFLNPATASAPIQNDEPTISQSTRKSINEKIIQENIPDSPPFPIPTWAAVTFDPTQQAPPIPS